ncbi:circadian locomoter output cycles protein kaput isoform X2 [Phymastichus coffea]|uniref:circadian locomoter output cycles protein kaput isoform X2 n=1 Tax=Phymastichus coffea TaxID=108790 RepID=UPI00273B0A23|nr:circadian locomoter output cycles protein kaput isoform X2 [Phymastichus coffea]
MASYIRNRSSTRQSDETMDDDNDEKDDTKRKSRNLSEKKRRDQFNMLVNELGSMVSTNTRKMDKSTVLKSTILFLKNHNELAIRSRAHEIQEDWKPSFLSNEEFTHLTLEALDGFIIVFSSSGRIYYASESVTSLLGYLPSELMNSTIYEIAFQEDQSQLYNILANSNNTRDQNSINKEHQVSFTCHIKRGGFDFREEPIYELVQFVGYFRTDNDTDTDSIISNRFSSGISGETKTVFVCTGRLQMPQLIREMSVVDNTKTEFTSRHSLEWKFLFLDHRAPPIIGYLPFEVLGTSGYDYYHVDDLDKVVTCHESLMKKGEGTSCHYRFLTKGQQWIWLQTRFYITYNQWNSKPEFIVCTHHVVSYVDVVKQMRSGDDEFSNSKTQDDVMSSNKKPQNTSIHIRTPSWSSKSSKTSRSVQARSRLRHGNESDTTSVSACSQSSRSFQQTPLLATGNKAASANSSTSSKPIISNSNGRSVDSQQQQQTQSPYQPQPQQQPQSQQQQQQQSPQQQRMSQKMKVEQQHCTDFLEPTQYSTVPMETIVAGAYTGTTDPALISPLQTTELLHQQTLVMTPTQNQIQDELQRKHEELQQLIVHQQEELRRVSEQLLIARYGIFSPLLNVGVSYNANLCQQTTRCLNTSHQSVPGVSTFPVPITLPVNIVSSELFPHPLPVNTVTAPPMASHGNVVQMMTPQQQFQNHPQLTQQQNQQQPEEQTSDLITFQMCQPNDLLYTNIEPPNQQQRSSSN